jgi:hypothetical protein
MTPTNKLRFVERQEIWHVYDTITTRTVRVLQQWWKYEDTDDVLAKMNFGLDEITRILDAGGGEWRDVPLEKEND